MNRKPPSSRKAKTATKRGRSMAPAEPKPGRSKSTTTAHFGEWHLAQTSTEQTITELEFAFLRIHESFGRWIQSLMGAVQREGLGFSENLILHVVRLQNRPRGAMQIAQFINRTDLHNVNYSLKKLETAGLVRKVKDAGSKMQVYSVTERGREVTDAYSELRRRLLVSQVDMIADADTRIGEACRVISLMTGIYEEQAAVAATYRVDPPEG